jgi:hypothetical protein
MQNQKNTFRENVKNNINFFPDYREIKEPYKDKNYYPYIFPPDKSLLT